MVDIGNGQVEVGVGVCRKVTLTVQGIKIERPFFVIPIGRNEVVLVPDWLASLGKVGVDFVELKLSWTMGGNQLKLQGISPSVELELHGKQP